MKELRCIVFQDKEVLAAVIDRRRKLRDPLPEAEITGMNISYADRLHTILEMENGKRTIQLDEAEVQAAVIAYCMQKNIPLPVEADKALYLIKGHVTLMITMNFQRAARIVSNAAASG